MRHLPPCQVNVESRGASRDVTRSPLAFGSCVAVRDLITRVGAEYCAITSAIWYCRTSGMAAR
ncbi:MAG: hypothetical protein ACKOGE_07500 [Actinomycetota bacterium]